MFLQFLTTLKNTLLLLGFIFFANNSKAQPAFGATTVENCYQKVTAGFSGKAQTVNFIKGLPSIKVGSTNYSDVKYWQVLAQDTYSRNIWVGDTIVSRIDTFWRVLIDSIIPKSGGVDINVPNNLDRIRITTPKDWFTGVPQSDTLEINFVEPEFNFFDKQKECLTFDMEELQCKLNLTNLCMEPKYRLILPPNATNRWGLPLNWFMTLEPGKKGQSIPIDPAACSRQDQIYLDQFGNTISYCIDFQLDILIEPCLDKIDICPPLHIKKKLKFCCFCGPWNNIQN